MMETFEESSAQKSCTCCTAVSYEEQNVNLMCPGGIQIRHKHSKITHCSCNASQCLP